MKPRFALNFSHDGLSLLHRVNGGWQIIGDVALDSSTLADSLRYLRKTATELAGGQFASKLVIPNSQVLYRDFSVPEGPREQRLAVIVQALKGSTPYPVEELAFDWRASGTGRVRVAAVARETLDEAEAFATEHRFNPVSFVATPENSDFTGEPFFGPTGLSETLLSAGDRVEPDKDIMVITGRASRPAPEHKTPDQETTVTPPDPSPDEKGHSGDTAELTQFSTRRSPGETADLPSSIDRLEPRFVLYGDTSGAAPKLGSAPITPEISEMPVTAPSLAGEQKPSIPKARSTKARKSKPRAKASAKPQTGSGDGPTIPIAPPPIHVPAAVFTHVSPPMPDAARPPNTPAPQSEAEALTVFGARRNNQVGGKPKYLGIALTLGLIVSLLLAALLSGLVLDKPISTSWLRGLFSRDSETAITVPVSTLTLPSENTTGSIAAQPAPPEDEGVALANLPAPDLAIESATAPALSELSESELAESEPNLPESAALDFPTFTPQTAEQFHRETGIWPLAPVPPVDMDIDRVDDVYVASIDRNVLSHDALALPVSPLLNNDTAFNSPPPPPPAGTVFDLDERGLVKASRGGTLSPDGILIFRGKPAVLPELRPTDAAPVVPQFGPLVPSKRPLARPRDLIELNERSQFGGRSLLELAKFRPVARPASPQDQDGQQDFTPTERAIASSPSPKIRPAGFATAVEKAILAAALESATQSVASGGAQGPIETASSGTAQGRAPQIPVRASVAREATFENAINLSRVNLIGIYGSSSERRALVRLKSGRYVKVQIGDRLDGGKVAAIGTNRLQYIKGKRTLTLDMPKG